MPVDSVTGTAATTHPTATARAPKQTMDSEMFLQLLVAQLRAQDPSSPMDTNEMMAQTTQLASMEQLTTMTKMTQESFSLQMRVAASALIGQEVSYKKEDGTTATGVVTSVSFEKPVPTVKVGDVELPLDAVAGVRPVPSTSN
ncbi:flagellar hook capping FlgD N-terminal domain-containing protein [Lysobacter korlensis]|uniref:Basal-body rod modification protein FlgD n=1 Tax=Lysobacter korlensis TaxID=553636 RepID=A0ABV6RUQ1_9GAMM